MGRVNGSPVKVGLLGCGNVGAALVRLIDEQGDAMSVFESPVL